MLLIDDSTNKTLFFFIMTKTHFHFMCILEYLNLFVYCHLFLIAGPEWYLEM